MGIIKLSHKDFNAGVKPSWYHKYLQQPHWRAIAHWAKSRAEWRCEKCGEPKSKTRELHAHHKHYKSLGGEKPDDVIVYCNTCHAIEHGIAANDPQYALFGDEDDTSG